MPKKPISLMDAVSYGNNDVALTEEEEELVQRSFPAFGITLQNYENTKMEITQQIEDISIN